MGRDEMKRPEEEITKEETIREETRKRKENKWTDENKKCYRAIQRDLFSQKLNFLFM